MKKDLIDEEDLKRLMVVATTIEYFLVFLEPRFFSSMLTSMPKWETVSMNFDDTTLREYFEHWRALTCCIHDSVCH